MNKTQMGRVQCLTGEVPGLEQVRQRLSGAAIDRVADERVADMRHMDAHLMGTAGFEAAFDEHGAVQRLDRTVMGDRMLAAARCDDRHLLAERKSTRLNYR